MSTAVIAATAIAAFIQIKHLRASNQVEGFNEHFRELFSTTLTESVAFIEGELQERLKDETFRRELSTGGSNWQRHPELRIGAFWEKTGTLLQHGWLDKELFLDYAGDVCPRHWLLLSEVCRLRREREPLIWERFEYLVKECERYKERRHHGSVGKSK